MHNFHTHSHLKAFLQNNFFIQIIDYQQFTNDLKNHITLSCDLKAINNDENISVFLF